MRLLDGSQRGLVHACCPSVAACLGRGSLLFCVPLWETCHRPTPRKGPAVQTAVCCLRRDMTGSALSNTFRLILSRGGSVHLKLRPTSLLPSLPTALDAPRCPDIFCRRLGPAIGRSGAYPDKPRRAR